MEIIPVIDLLDGHVVQAMKGRRNEYRPIKSLLINSSRPLDVAKVFKEELGLNKVYIADLNSILRKGNNFKLIKEIKEKLMLDIFLDYGIGTTNDLKQEIVAVADNLILGTETLASFRILDDALKFKKQSHIFVSIDMKGKDLVSLFREFKEPIDMINKFIRLRMKNFIFLDLENVGTMQGPSATLKDLILKIEGMNLYVIVGGGIRRMDDILFLRNLKINAVLIATALHQKKITKNDIVKIRNESPDNSC